MELPITALDVPRNIDVTLTALPARSSAIGVGDETMSTLNTVIELLNEIRRKHRPARAGLRKFFPRPPKQHLTTRIAKTDPMIGPYSGVSGESDRARRRPVTAALPSL